MAGGAVRNHICTGRQAKNTYRKLSQQPLSKVVSSDCQKYVTHETAQVNARSHQKNKKRDSAAPKTCK